MSPLRNLTAPVACLFGAVARLRGALYDFEVLPKARVSCPVVSVGNLTTGGTGKTPLIIELARQLSERDVRVGIVSRGYGRLDEKQIAFVTGEPGAAEQFGDEPCLMAQELKGVPIVVGADRVRAAQALLEKEKVNLILADDAFQHRRLHRDFDVVVLDCMASKQEYRPLPWGNSREGFSALQRAHWLIYSKANLVQPEDLNWLRAKVAHHYDGPSSEAYYELQNAMELRGATSPILLVSGVGRPESLEGMIRPHREIAGHLRFKDHQAYGAAEVARIQSELKALGLHEFWTTAKDAVKLAGFAELSSMLRVLKLQLRLKPEVGMYEAISRLVR